MTRRARLGWVWFVGGCSFTPGQLPDAQTGPIAANAVSCSCTFTAGGSSARAVRTGSHDAEQDGVSVSLGSGDLDLATETVGLRFDDVHLPPGATITAAHVQFTADASQSASTTLQIVAQIATDAAPFTTADGDLTGRAPTSAAPVSWTLGAWSNGDAGAAQRTPELAGLLQELVDQPGWTTASPVVLLFATGTGSRTARSFDGDPTDAARLEVTYAVQPAAVIPTCATDRARDGEGFLTSPQSTCDTLEDTLGGLNAACGLPATVTCAAVDREDPNGDDLPDSYQADVCDAACAANEVDGACTEYDPVAFVDCLERGNPLATCQALHVSATHAGGDTPICVASGSPLAAHALGRRSTCEVTGTSGIEIGGTEPKQDPDTEGAIELLGGPCPGADCFVRPSFLLDMEPISFDVRFASDPVFEDLAVAGAGEDPRLLVGGLAIYEPESVAGTGTGRSGGDGLAIDGTNPDDLDLGVDWVGRTCDLEGTLSIGVGGDGVCEADAAVSCRSDAGCPQGVCLLPADFEVMSVDVDVAGTLVNQPPTAVAGPDSTLECTSTAGATFTLDGRGSTDPDGDLVLASWRSADRVGTEVASDLVASGALGVGASGTFVLRVIDGFAQLDEDAVDVTVVDTTAPTIACNAPATMRPQDADSAPTFTSTATDTCDADVATTVTGYDCFGFTPNGRRTSRLDDCVVSLDGGAVTVSDVGGYGDHVTWTVEATDDSGNTATTTCEIRIAR